MPIDSQGQPEQISGQAPSTATSAVSDRLTLCTFNRFGVQTVYTDGQASEVGMPDNSTFISGPPAASPPLVAILLQGVNSAVSGGQFDPSSANFCSSNDGSAVPANSDVPLESLARGWFTLNDDNSPSEATPAPGAGNNLIDSLASTGGYVLPFSYNGTAFTRIADSISIDVTEYTKSDVAHGLIQNEQKVLDQEVADIRRLWPGVPILVVGHSNGGLIAEQWWLNDRNHLQDVAQVVSLDSPLNGVYRAHQCLAGQIVPWLCEKQGVGQGLNQYYASLWDNQATNDPYWVQEDDQDKIFTPIGTIGDPLFDFGDWPATSTFGVKNIGIVSQVYFTEPSCAEAFDLSVRDCTMIGQSFLNPCGPLDDGSGPGFSIAQLWLHSVVKNCPGVISKIMSFVPTTSPEPEQSAPPPTPSAPPAPSASAGPVKAGQDTPADVVYAFYQAEEKGDWGEVCSLLEPAVQSTCTSAESGNSTKGTGHFVVHASVTKDQRALVEVTGSLCFAGEGCYTNGDPEAGMPTSDAAFDQVFTSLTNGSTTVLSPVPAVEVGGKWYVDLSF